MTKRHLYSANLFIPVFIKLEIDDDMIVVSSYEELAKPMAVPGQPGPANPAEKAAEEKTTPMVGRITGLPAGRFVLPYNLQGLKRVIKELPDSMFAKDPTQIDGRLVLKMKDFKREIVKGEKLDSSMKGRDFVLLSSAALSRKDAQLRKQWKDLAVWVFEIDADGILQLPHNVGLLMGDLGGMPTRLTAILNRFSVLTVYQPFAGAPFGESSFYLKANANYGFSATNQSQWKQTTGGEIQNLVGTMMPRLRVVSAPKSVGASSPATVELEAFDPNTGKVVADYPLTVELKVLSGYVPQTTLNLEKGRARFRAMGLGLEKGETVRVQAGVGYSMYKLDIELTVS